MKGELILIDEIDYDTCEFEVGLSVHDFSLSIYVNDEKTLEKQLNNKDAFNYCINNYKEMRSKSKRYNQYQEKEIDYIEKHFENILDSVEYIKLAFKYNNVKDFIRKNPLILSKKIVLSELLEISDYNKILKLMDEYKDIINNVYVCLKGNDNYISLSDCYNTMNEIKKQADYIKKLDLSPMETVMYLYDQVRNRVYRYESACESSFKSRDLSEVIFGNKIVCVGYANIYYALLSYLGINSGVVHLNDKNDRGHTRNIIYVKDPKYGIDGVYYFDPTWDSKKKENDNSYLYVYKFFAKTREYMDENYNKDLEDIHIKEFSNDMYKKIEKIIEAKDYEKLVPYVKSLNNMAKIMNQDILIEIIHVCSYLPFYGQFDTKLFLERFKDIFDKFNKELSAEILIKLLNNVRKVEYYQNPEWYPYSIETIYKTFMKSGWKFKDIHLDSKTKLLRELFGDMKNETIKPIDNFRNYGFENNLFKDIERVRLAKVLQKTLKKKQNTN